MKEFDQLEVESICVTTPTPIMIEVLASPLLNELPISMSDQPIVYELEVSQSRTSIIYTRRKGTIVQDSECQPHELDSSSLNPTSENITPLAPLIDDATLLIAYRKGVRSCTSHPIEKYAAYGKFLSSYQVLRTIQDALKDLEWKKFVNEEINSLEKKKKIDLFINLIGRMYS